MPRILKTIEQQVRLFRVSVADKSFLGASLRALFLPYRTVKKYAQSVAYTGVVVSDEFDLEHGTQTSTRAHITDLNIAHPNWIHATPYFPTPSRLLAEILEGLDIRFENLTFVDLGSGKGRVLFMASEFPFSKIIGVELSSELTEIARRNIASYKGPQRCRDINLVCMDFTEFEFPEQPLFVFLYNPASLQLSTVLAQNLMRSLKKCPREIWILYVTPHEVFDSENNLQKVRAGECCGHPYSLYRTKDTALAFR